ncbi:hypothetical protein Ddc_12895 [Ditylenchus destructor]|nr:hypothetical protein Ddc_12895 [Ditylenchus destructor]
MHCYLMQLPLRWPKWPRSTSSTPSSSHSTQLLCFSRAASAPAVVVACHTATKNVILSLLPPNGYFLLLAAWMVFHPNNCERGIFVCLTDFIPHPVIEPLDIDSAVLRPSKHIIVL